MSNIVVKHNDLISASYRLSLIEQRIVLNCISKIRSDLPAGTQAFSVSVEEFAAMHNITEGRAYYDLRDAVKNLYDRTLSIDAENMPEEYKQQQGINGRIDVRWLTAKAIYDPDQKKVYLWFSPQILPYLTQLKNNFTKYDLGNVSSMTSAHAIRIYELLAEKQFQKHKKFNISILELRARLQLSQSHSTFGNLNSRVLTPAITQINKHSNFDVAVKTIKEGRKVMALRFEFSVKKGQGATRAPEKNPNKVVTAKEVDQNARPGETRKQAADRIKKEKAGIKGLKQALRK